APETQLRPQERAARPGGGGAGRGGALGRARGSRLLPRDEAREGAELAGPGGGPGAGAGAVRAPPSRRPGSSAAAARAPLPKREEPLPSQLCDIRFHGRADVLRCKFSSCHWPGAPGSSPPPPSSRRRGVPQPGPRRQGPVPSGNGRRSLWAAVVPGERSWSRGATVSPLVAYRGLPTTLLQNEDRVRHLCAAETVAQPSESRAARSLSPPSALGTVSAHGTPQTLRAGPA
ncbi:PREDICTED: translation initiation factor IF-2-like, partial [Chinchilla lanigera]|uniref:translation initiation factor IF-2-like n=1 Tax=Chinchilla lanigera TaxID=34839 RepID=UPI0006992185